MANFCLLEFVALLSLFYVCTASVEVDLLQESSLEEVFTPCYAVLMDAGSTGTRVHVYSWDAQRPLETLNEVANTRERIALSSLVDNHLGVVGLLQTLVSFADEHIPAISRANTSISLKATAGLRRLSTDDQESLVASVHSHFRESHYAFLPGDTAVIPGHEEALYDYMAVVVAMDDIAMGVLDLGGASKQLSYVVDLTPHSTQEVAVEVTASGEGILSISDNITISPPEEQGEGVCVPDYILQIPGTTSPTGLVARSIQGMGLLAAMDMVVDLYVTEQSEGVGVSVVPQPCLAIGETAKGDIHDYDTPLVGYGNVTECYEVIRHHFLDKVAAEIDLACLQKHKPKKFVALDNFPKVMEMLGFVGAAEDEALQTITPQTVLAAGQDICALSWEELLARFPSDYPAYRAQRACFGAAYIYFFMKDVYGIHELSQGEFFPLDSHNEHDLGWVLGAVAVSAHHDRDELLTQVPTKP